jgi:histidine triad (HIT) family protein
MSCTFCSIIDGETRSWPVFENEDTVAVLDVAPATPGHTLVLPRQHTRDIWTLTEDEAARIMRSVHRVARLLLERLRPLGLNVIQSNGSAAWQDVLHYHVHLVPRYGEDELVPPWHPSSQPDDQLTAIQQRILGPPR